jgi:hypothetical protein
MPPEALEVWENLQGSARARQVVKDTLCEAQGFLFGVGPELERTHTASVGDEARPILRGWNAAELLDRNV